jgi:hypothetical protein
MIVREMADGQLLCINQMAHSMMAAVFCRHWGNDEFAPPIPYEPVMLGIAQHDNGWYDWEQSPQLRHDGYPMDFLHGPVGREKLELWQGGIERVYLQHPYAGLIAGQHAAWMHAESLPTLAGEERCETQAFIDAQSERIVHTRRYWRDSETTGELLDEVNLIANTRLLQFGDTASLQVTMPWESERTFPYCPYRGGTDYVSIRMCHDHRAITFDPWPYNIDSFQVSVHGKLLSQRYFCNQEAYHAALAAAPYRQLTWTVSRTM